MKRTRDSIYPFPADGNPHQTLQPINSDQRIIIVGDPHGCLDELQELLQKCDYQKSRDSVLLLGDLVNKGPKSAELVRFARTEGLLSLKGNHDDFAVFCYRHNISKPGCEWIQNMDEQDVRFLEYLPFTVSIPQFNSIVVHAGLVPGLALKDQHHGTLYSVRNLLAEEGKWVAAENDFSGEPWAKVWPGPEHIYFGHDAFRGLQQYPHATGLDTGCVYGFELSCCILPECKIVSVQAKEQYAKPTREGKL